MTTSAARTIQEGDDSANELVGRCADGRICEDHPTEPMGHGGCSGAGMPCENPACGHSIKKTGLVCPSAGGWARRSESRPFAAQKVDHLRA